MLCLFHDLTNGLLRKKWVFCVFFLFKGDQKNQKVKSRKCSFISCSCFTSGRPFSAPRECAWLSKERVHWHLIHYMLKFPVLKKISKVNLSHETGLLFKLGLLF